MMGIEFDAAISAMACTCKAQDPSLGIPEPRKNQVAGSWLAAEDDITLLGLNAVVAPRSPEYARRISRA